MNIIYTVYVIFLQKILFVLNKGITVNITENITENIKNNRFNQFI